MKVWLVEFSEDSAKVAATLEAAKKVAEEGVQDYFRKPMEWRLVGDIWVGTYWWSAYSRGTVYVNEEEVIA